MLVYAMSHNDEPSDHFDHGLDGDCKSGYRKRGYRHFSAQGRSESHMTRFPKRRITATDNSVHNYQEMGGIRHPHIADTKIDYSSYPSVTIPNASSSDIHTFNLERMQYGHHLDQRIPQRQNYFHSAGRYDWQSPIETDLIQSSFSSSKVSDKQSNGRKWTPEEDSVLRTGVEHFLKKEEQVDFNTIVERLPGRSVKQAKERWGNCLNPDITKGEWTNDEVKKLLKLIQTHGPQWTVIQKNLQSRSMHCIKSKGRKLLGEALNKKVRKLIGSTPVNKYWTEDEQKKLLKYHEMHTYDLNLICLELARNGFCRPPAQVDRQLLATCPCKKCTVRKEALVSNEESLKIVWTKAKATALLLRM